MKRISVILFKMIRSVRGTATCSVVEDGRRLYGKGRAVHQSGTPNRFTESELSFTRNVQVDMGFSPRRERPVSDDASVTIESGMGSARHARPTGRTRGLSSGIALLQEWGRPVEKIRPGNVMKCPADARHGHSALIHLAVTGDNGKQVDGKEKAQSHRIVQSESFFDFPVWISHVEKGQSFNLFHMCIKAFSTA